MLKACHPRAGGDPFKTQERTVVVMEKWIPACAGMTMLFVLLFISFAQAATSADPIISGANPGEPRPTIIFLHGKGGSGRQMQHQIAMDQELARAGMVAIYPSGQNAQWRVGKFQSIRNDVDYLDGLIDDYVARRVIDPKRLYIVGMSNGGLMVQRLICQSKYQFTGAAVVMATHPNVKNCPEPKPTPLMIFFGAQDKFFPPDGVEPNAWAKRMGFESRASTINFWRAANGCPRDVLPMPVLGGAVEVRGYPDCQVPFAVYDLIGVGHAWPGAKKSLRMGDDPAREPGKVKIDQILLNAWAK